MGAVCRIMIARGWLDWAAVAVALQRAHRFEPALMSAAQVDAFATQALSRLPEAALACGVELVGLGSMRDGAALRAAERLCERIGAPLRPAWRKWRAASLQAWLAQDRADPLYDLLDLAALWSQWDRAQGGFRGQGVGADALAPGDYYSAAHLQAVLLGQRAWLDAEAAAIDSGG